MKATLIEDKDHKGVFRVEAIDGDGGVEVAIFSGPNAKDRAFAFAGGLGASLMAAPSREAVEAVALALEPKCRAFGTGNMPMVVAREFATASLTAALPHLLTTKDAEIAALQAEINMMEGVFQKIIGLRSWAERWAADEPCGGPHTTIVQTIDTLKKS